jgi:hypothetical protein
MVKYRIQFTVLLLACFFSGICQDNEANPFDFGRMWTFENPPIEWFEKAYDLKADKAWFDDVRKSSLRFATWCSASFVSPDGLIMTNHHCSRDEAIGVQQDGENFDVNGYYAATLADERRVNDLFVEQLIMVDDITEDVNAYTKNAIDDAAVVAQRQEALKSIEEEYAKKKGWEGLRLQTVTFYSGGKFSIYGYKKYSDIRLVCIPENDLGFYGGDPDNFTYPRYNLDFTFWRAYDENGKPVNTSEYYYEFNPDGVKEGTPVFVVGNPGRTERYRTVAQLEYDRDYRFKHLLRWLTNRRDMMLEEYEVISLEPAKEREAQELLGTINNLSNSIKAYTGIVKGLHNDNFMGRKKTMENSIKKESNGLSYWDDLENEYNIITPHAWAVNHLGASPYRGQVFMLMHSLYAYKNAVDNDADDAEKKAMKESALEMANNINVEKEKVLMTVLLNEIKTDIYPGDATLDRVTGGVSIDAYVDKLFSDSDLLNGKADKVLSKEKNIKKAKDPLIKASEILVQRYNEAGAMFQASSAKRRVLESKIANQAFNVYGTSLPPDATFTLRISDGLVKSYEYNGTKAPIMTTYFGLYDRHYSFNQKFPWALPEKWANPPLELLKSPMNFVSTNDIIGGNSGSAIINEKGEAVGLVFDGNIESLPGNFIYDEEYNRTVSVHAGGIMAALKYIYKADRLVDELIKR